MKRASSQNSGNMEYQFALIPPSGCCNILYLSFADPWQNPEVLWLSSLLAGGGSCDEGAGCIAGACPGSWAQSFFSV